MTARPLPPHGSYARANGSRGYRKPCTCGPCITERRRYKKRDHTNRQLGRPGHVDATQARERLLNLNQATGWNDLATAFGGSAANLRDIAFGRRTRIKRTTHNKIMTLTATPSAGQYIDATGSIRRLRALQAIGWTAEKIAVEAGSGRARMLILINGEQQHIRRALAARITAAYRTLGDKHGTSTRSRNRAAREAWAPPGAWDDDRIDDPTAAPDWTGYCGTDRGWWTHQRQQIPTCKGCEKAHEEWLAKHATLAPQQRNQALFRARAAAVSREADLAADARELITYGNSVEQAATRLGVTKNHLQQALRRNPDTETELAA